MLKLFTRDQRSIFIAAVVCLVLFGLFAAIKPVPQSLGTMMRQPAGGAR